MDVDDGFGKKSNGLCSAYPFFPEAMRYPVGIATIGLHPNRLEATLELRLGDILLYAFDTLFYRVVADVYRLFGVPVWRVEAVVARPDDAELILPLLVPEPPFQAGWRPSPGDWVGGSAWMQGYLVQDAPGTSDDSGNDREVAQRLSGKHRRAEAIPEDAGRIEPIDNAAGAPTAPRPDLGLLHLQNGFSGEDRIFFYDIALTDIDFVSDTRCSTTFEMPFGADEYVYALSLDFDRAILDRLIAGLSPGERAAFLASVDGRETPFRARLPRPVTFAKLACRLGELQSVEAETFVPFVVEDLA